MGKRRKVELPSGEPLQKETMTCQVCTETFPVLLNRGIMCNRCLDLYTRMKLNPDRARAVIEYLDREANEAGQPSHRSQVALLLRVLRSALVLTHGDEMEPLGLSLELRRWFESLTVLSEQRETERIFPWNDFLEKVKSCL